MAKKKKGIKFDKTANKVFEELHNLRTPVLRRCEDYARWSLAHIFPEITATDQDNIEKPKSQDSSGAAAVNTLSNKLILTMFRPAQPFVRLRAESDLLEALVAEAKTDVEANDLLTEIDKELSKAEQDVMKELDFSHYRTEATTTAKRLVITGNAMLYHPEDGSRTQSYSVRDYVVRRDISGNVVEFVTKDTKALATFKQEIKDQILKSKKKKRQAKKDDSDISLYTHLKLGEDGRFHIQQYADEIKLDTEGAWTKDDLPWIVLTWNLSRGSDYGTGLVEDYAGAFHGLYQLSRAFVSVVGVAADIKWLVNPASMLDVEHLNNSESGTYHMGGPEDIVAMQLNKTLDLQVVMSQIQDWRQQIGQAFLMFSSVQRDAERVTAEETRQIVDDLEIAHGGIYSRFADEWQRRTAILMLKRVDIKVGKDTQIYPQIITGLDSLSRAGDLQNLRLMFSDLAMLNDLPEAVTAVINLEKFIAYVGVRRGVEYEKFVKTPEEIEADQQRAMQMQKQQLQQQTQADVATEAGKQAVQPQ